MTAPKANRRFTASAAVAALAGALLAGVAATGVLPWYVPLAAALLPALLTRRPRALLCLILFLFGWGAFALRAALSPRPELGARDLRARMVLVLDDPRISSVPGGNGGARFVRAELRAYSDPATGRMLPGRGAVVMVKLPDGDAPPEFGTVIEAEGTVSPLTPADENDEFRVRLRRRNVAAVVRAEKWRRTGRETGVRSFLADGRDALLTRLFDGVRSTEARRLAAAIYCGVASDLPDRVREDFGAAGIIHVFSVSGIHVAVLALCFAWLLRVLPFRVRAPALAALVWLYVLATGAGTPAVRAGVMVTLWALLRQKLLRLRGIDVLCWTAALLVAADPLLVAEPGAQYSFLITGALLLLAERRDKRKFPRLRRQDLVPRLFSSRFRRAAGTLLVRAETLGVAAATAFLAGAAVSLRTGRRRLGTGAVAANVLLALMMPGFFALFFVQLLMGTLGAGRFTAPLFERAFLGLRAFAAFFGRRFPDAGAAPPHWSVALVYTAALLVALRSRRKVVCAAALSLVAAIGIWQLARPAARLPALLVHAAEYGRPPLVAVADPKHGRAVIVNVPDAVSARRAAEFLRERGIREAELVTVSSPDGVSAKGVAALQREIAVRRVRVAPGAGKRLASFSGASVENAASSGDLCRVVPLKNGFRLDYFDHGSKLYFGVSVTAGDAGCEVVVERPGGSARRLLPWSIDREEWEYGSER